jgi:hypothetical protein
MRHPTVQGEFQGATATLVYCKWKGRLRREGGTGKGQFKNKEERRLKKEDRGGKAQEGVSNAKNEIFRPFGYMKLIIQYRLGYTSFG